MYVPTLLLLYCIHQFDMLNHTRRGLCYIAEQTVKNISILILSPQRLLSLSHMFMLNQVLCWRLLVHCINHFRERINSFSVCMHVHSYQTRGIPKFLCNWGLSSWILQWHKPLYTNQGSVSGFVSYPCDIEINIILQHCSFMNWT